MKNRQNKEKNMPFQSPHTLYKQYCLSLKKHMNDPYHLVANAENHLEFIQNKCETYVKKHNIKVKTEISIEDYTASITFDIPIFVLGDEEWKLFEEIRPYAEKTIFTPFRFELTVTICILYFNESDNPSLRAFREVYQ